VVETVKGERGVSWQSERVDGKSRQLLGRFLIAWGWTSGSRGEFGQALGDEEDQVDHESIGGTWGQGDFGPRYACGDWDIPLISKFRKRQLARKLRLAM